MLSVYVVVVSHSSVVMSMHRCWMQDARAADAYSVCCIGCSCCHSPTCYPLVRAVLETMLVACVAVVVCHHHHDTHDVVAAADVAVVVVVMSWYVAQAMPTLMIHSMMLLVMPYSAMQHVPSHPSHPHHIATCVTMLVSYSPETRMHVVVVCWGSPQVRVTRRVPCRDPSRVVWQLMSRQHDVSMVGM